MIHLDSSFAIDLLREIASKRDGPAQAFLAAHATEAFGVSVFVVCELLMGAELASKPTLEKERIVSFCRNLQIDFPDERFAPLFAQQYARLEKAGFRMATMDLLIATSALLAGAALLTRDTGDFVRVSRLKLLAY